MDVKSNDKSKLTKRFFKIAAVITVVAIVAAISISPAFAATGVGGGIIQWAQGLFSNSRAVETQAPMTLEEGVEALSSSTGLRVVEFAAGGNHSLAILSNGTLWAWGSGANGQLGLDSTANALVPTQVPTPATAAPGTTWDSVAIGNTHSLAILSNGTLWAWGGGANGQLGLDSTANVHVPTQVGDLTSWNSIATGNAHSLATKIDGTLWAWGHGGSGQHGLNSTAHVHIPTQVGTDDDWDSISGGGNYSLATKINGTLWAWGSGADGILGLDSTANVHVPTQVGDLTGWDSISGGANHSLAIRSDGTLWAWGRGSSGQLGLDDTTRRLVPTQVGDLTTWDSIATGLDSSLATKTDGTLWAWGNGDFGRTGLGSFANVHVPTQVGNLTTWDSISTRSSHTLATRTDGTLWVWGWGSSGQTGLNSTANATTPTLVHARATANTPANNAINVSLDTNTISITFNRPMAAVGNITIDQGASIDVAAGSWNAARTVFTAPLTLVVGDTLHTVTVENSNGAPGSTASNAGPGNFPSYHWWTPHTFSFTTEPGIAPLTVVEVFPGGNRVSVETDYMSIVFDAPVNTTNLGTVTLNGETLNVSNATWSGDNTILTIPLPELDYSTGYTVVIDGFRTTEGGVMTNPHTHNFRTEPEPQSGLFTKVLELPLGTTVPSPEFSFNFVPVVQRLNNESPAIYSEAVDRFEDLVTSPQSIRLDARDATSINLDTLRVTGELDLWNLLNTTDFSSAGVFVWNVYEVEGSSNTESPSHMSYDPNRFQVRVWVDQDGIEFIAIHSLAYDEATSTWIVDDKLEEGITFNNFYRRDVERTPEEAALEVSKEVTGQFANLNTPFSFRLDLIAHSLAPIDFSELEAFIYTGNTRGVAVEINSNGLGTTFTLLDNQRLVIPTLPAGTTFSVAELATAGFSPSVTVRSGGEVVFEQISEEAIDLLTGTHLVRDSGRNAADFINEYRFVPPTGLSLMNSVPLVLVGALVNRPDFSGRFYISRFSFLSEVFSCSIP